jgi:class 3 adenylate cyclase
MDVTNWLQSLGLACYEGVFRENGITADLLPSLTKQDLQDLGITRVGDRRRLLNAITALRRDARSPTKCRSEFAESEHASEAFAERRQITVLFCDLVDSTLLSTRLDPEDYRSILETYRVNVAAAVANRRGYVARFIGDGVLAYFGWPNPDEAHCDSAARAAIAIVAAVRSNQLSVRLGIATGLVVVGDLIGAGASLEYPAIGETPNLAARLQAAADPNDILVSEATRSQLGHTFESQNIGPLLLKGFEKPIRPWRVQAGTAALSRSESAYTNPMLPLIGRDEELDLLSQRWHEVKDGANRVVLLSGEAGIGKSRLLAAFEERLAAEAYASLRYFCSPNHQEIALYPIIARLEHEAGFSSGEGAQNRLAKLEAILAPDTLPLVADLLGVKTDGGYPTLNLNPQQRKKRTLDALADRVAGTASKRTAGDRFRGRALVGPNLARVS